MVSVRPVYKNETNTEARLKARNKFRKASDYASAAMESVKLKSYYTQKARQLKLPNAYTAALTDYLRKAKAAVITRSSFAAKRGDTLQIKMSKGKFNINQITVTAVNTKDEVVATQALVLEADKNTFELTLTDDWPDFTGLQIATDEPGDKRYAVLLSEFIKAGNL